MRITKIFRGFIFPGTRPIREKREILHRAKISRYTVYTPLVWCLPKTTLALGPSEKTIQVALSPPHPPCCEPDFLDLCYYWHLIYHIVICRVFADNLPQPPPDDFEVDVTDPALFLACDVSLPGMCRSVIAETASAPSLTVAPLVILLFFFAAKLFAS